MKTLITDTVQWVTVMGEGRYNVLVTVPELDIERREAATVKTAPARFSVWWGEKPLEHNNYPYSDPDMTVPNEMIIIEQK